MRELRLILIAPSRYDAEGVLVFKLGISPNGAVATLSGLAEDYNRRHAAHSRIDYEFFDEPVCRAVTPEVLKAWRDEADAKGQKFLIMLCGIQTHTYPRARDIALMARAEGIDVVAGGVHLSGHGPSVDFLLTCGVHVGIGEAEPFWDDIIEDAFKDQLLPIYHVDDSRGVRVKTAASTMAAPDITSVPFPHVPKHMHSRYMNKFLYIDSSRGCPFVCTFCVLKTVFGGTPRARDPKALSEWMVERVEKDGIKAFFFTDDNFLRSPRHLELLTLLGEARARGHKFHLSMLLDVEAACYAEDDTPRGERTREFLRLCEAAGVANIFIGLESTNDASLQEMDKDVNRNRDEVRGTADTAKEITHKRLIERYRAAVRAWHSIGTTVECGYILGYNADGPNAGVEAARDLIEVGVDAPIFFLVSPLPGAEDYARAKRENLLLESDFNEYYQDRPLIRHATLSREVLQEQIKLANGIIWSWPNTLRRVFAGLLGIGRKRVMTPRYHFMRQFVYRVTLSTGMSKYLEGGIGRRTGALTAKRHAVTDEEARRYYLGDLFQPKQSVLPPHVRDDSRMDSLPILAELVALPPMRKRV